MSFGKPKLDKGKISFAIKSRLLKPLVQYSDEESTETSDIVTSANTSKEDNQPTQIEEKAPISAAKKKKSEVSIGSIKPGKKDKIQIRKASFVFGKDSKGVSRLYDSDEETPIVDPGVLREQMMSHARQQAKQLAGDISDTPSSKPKVLNDEPLGKNENSDGRKIEDKVDRRSRDRSSDKKCRDRRSSADRSRDRSSRDRSRDRTSYSRNKERRSVERSKEHRSRDRRSRDRSRERRSAERSRDRRSPGRNRDRHSSDGRSRDRDRRSRSNDRSRRSRSNDRSRRRRSRERSKDRSRHRRSRDRSSKERSRERSRERKHQNTSRDRKDSRDLHTDTQLDSSHEENLAEMKSPEQEIVRADNKKDKTKRRSEDELVEKMEIESTTKHESKPSKGTSKDEKNVEKEELYDPFAASESDASGSQSEDPIPPPPPPPEVKHKPQKQSSKKRNKQKQDAESIMRDIEKLKMKIKKARQGKKTSDVSSSSTSESSSSSDSSSESDSSDSSSSSNESDHAVNDVKPAKPKDIPAIPMVTKSRSTGLSKHVKTTDILDIPLPGEMCDPKSSLSSPTKILSPEKSQVKPSRSEMSYKNDDYGVKKEKRRSADMKDSKQNDDIWETKHQKTKYQEETNEYQKTKYQEETKHEKRRSQDFMESKDTDMILESKYKKEVPLKSDRTERKVSESIDLKPVTNETSIKDHLDEIKSQVSREKGKEKESIQQRLKKFAMSQPQKKETVSLESDSLEKVEDISKKPDITIYPIKFNDKEVKTEKEESVKQVSKIGMFGPKTVQEPDSSANKTAEAKGRIKIDIAFHKDIKARKSVFEAEIGQIALKSKKSDERFDIQKHGLKDAKSVFTPKPAFEVPHKQEIEKRKPVTDMFADVSQAKEKPKSPEMKLYEDFDNDDSDMFVDSPSSLKKDELLNSNKTFEAKHSDREKDVVPPTISTIPMEQVSENWVDKLKAPVEEIPPYEPPPMLPEGISLENTGFGFMGPGTDIDARLKGESLGQQPNNERYASEHVSDAQFAIGPGIESNKEFPKEGDDRQPDYTPNKRKDSRGRSVSPHRKRSRERSLGHRRRSRDRSVSPGYRRRSRDRSRERRRRSRSWSRDRRRSRSRERRRDDSRRRSPEYSRRRRRSPSYDRRRSPSYDRRRRSPSPRRRRSISPYDRRRRSPSPRRRRSPSPRRRSPSPRRRSISPRRRHSPYRRRRSPSPHGRRTPSPVVRRRRSPTPDRWRRHGSRERNQKPPGSLMLELASIPLPPQGGGSDSDQFSSLPPGRKGGSGYPASHPRDHRYGGDNYYSQSFSSGPPPPPPTYEMGENSDIESVEMNENDFTRSPGTPTMHELDDIPDSTEHGGKYREDASPTQKKVAFSMKAGKSSVHGPKLDAFVEEKEKSRPPLPANAQDAASGIYGRVHSADNKAAPGSQNETDSNFQTFSTPEPSKRRRQSRFSAENDFSQVDPVIPCQPSSTLVPVPVAPISNASIETSDSTKGAEVADARENLPKKTSSEQGKVNEDDLFDMILFGANSPSSGDIISHTDSQKDTSNISSQDTSPKIPKPMSSRPVSPPKGQYQAYRSYDTEEDSSQADRKQDTEEDDEKTAKRGRPRRGSAKQEDDAETPVRRRSSRLRNQEKEEKPKEEKEKKTDGEKKKRGRGRPRKEVSSSETASESSSVPVPPQSTTPPAATPLVNIIETSQCSDSKHREFAIPDSVPRRDTPEFGSPSSYGLKPEKVKSRWRRWSELEATSTQDEFPTPPPPPQPSRQEFSSPPQPLPPKKAIMEGYSNNADEFKDGAKPDLAAGFPGLELLDKKRDAHLKEPNQEAEKENLEPPKFTKIIDNEFISERKKSKSRKEARRMVCDCSLPGKDDFISNSEPCGEDCLNRMLMIECGSRCACGDQCTNKRFQKHQYSPTEPFQTHWKGWGLRATADLPVGSFVMEYVGEVLQYDEFLDRTHEYENENQKHFYFMALNADEIIDATRKGNNSRFINHCCDPNAETQKWTVNGHLRVGFFTIKPVAAGEEITFDYQFESYGQEAQKCYCGADNCRGWLSGEKKFKADYDEDVDESEEGKDERKRKKKRDKRRKRIFDDLFLEEEIAKMVSLDGMKRKDHVLEMCRLMVRAENSQQRASLIKVLLDTKEPACLRLFLDYHGLSLLWSWMVDVPRDDSPLKLQMLEVLKQLPISNKTILKDSKILSIVHKWSTQLSFSNFKGESTDTGRDTDTQSEPSTPKVQRDSHSGASTPKIGSIGTGDTPLEGLPHKKRRLLMRLQEEASSSDSEMSDSSKAKEKAHKLEEKGDNSQDEEGMKDMSETSMDVADQTPTPEQSEMMSVAKGLLTEWDTLKEVFKIPKLHLEERKKREQELEQRTKERGYTDKEKEEMEKKEKLLRRKRFGDNTPEHRAPEPKKKKVYATDSTEDPPWLQAARKVLHPTGRSKIDKHERRKLFEAQVRAQDELREIEEQQLQQQHMEFLKDPAYVSYLQQHGFQLDDQSMAIIQSQQYQEQQQQALLFQQETAAAAVMQQQLQAQELAAAQQQAAALQAQLLPPPSQPSQISSVPSQIIDPSNPALATAQFMEAQPALAALPPQAQQSLFQATPPSTPQYPPLAFEEPSWENNQVAGAVSQQSAAVAAAAAFLQQQAPAPAIQTSAAPPQFVQQSQPQMQLQQQVYYTAPTGSQVIVQQPVLEITQPQPIIATQVVTDATPSPHMQSLQARLQTLGFLPGSPASSQPEKPAAADAAIPGLGDLPAPTSSSTTTTTTQEPPPPPPKKNKLPPNWKSAKDEEGKTYYYHSVTRQTQWDPPEWDGTEDDSMDLGTPNPPDSSPRMKKGKETTTAAADTSSEVAKRIKDQFRSKISRHIVACLNPFRKPDCKLGKITCTEDFKHLARKLTHAVLDKELKHCRHVEDLEVNENVKSKAKEFVKKYMTRFGPVYKKVGGDSPN